MLTTAETPDRPRGAILFARIPETLDESGRQLKYDEPLRKALADGGLACHIHGYTLPDGDGEPRSVGIEVVADSSEPLALVVQEIADLGAPPETVIEIESDKATIEFSLADVAGP